MTKGDECPKGTELRIYAPPAYNFNKRLCGNGLGDDGVGCSSTFFDVQDIEYGEVCGQIKGYKHGSPDAFGIVVPGQRGTTVDSNYVDGISLTHGSNPRQHIWTFAGTLDEHNKHPKFLCPCTRTDMSSQATPPPGFVGEDYFCETAMRNEHWDYEFHGKDPLWDGLGCGDKDNCCKRYTVTRPYFRKQLSSRTTDQIEMRMCRDDSPPKVDHFDDDYETNSDHKALKGDATFDEDTPIEKIEIYVR